MSEQRTYFAKDAAFDDELERLHIRERETDPATIRRLLHLGVAEGWCCLEIGAGGGSIARWLGERVGPNGRVVVIDITGAPDVDETVANHLVQTVDASRLMGASVIITGLSPKIAQTLVDMREQALLYRKLATLVEDVPLREGLGDLEWKGVPRARFEAVCAGLGAGNLLTRPGRFRA